MWTCNLLRVWFHITTYCVVQYSTVEQILYSLYLHCHYCTYTVCIFVVECSLFLLPTYYRAQSNSLIQYSTEQHERFPGHTMAPFVKWQLWQFQISLYFSVTMATQPTCESDRIEVFAFYWHPFFGLFNALVKKGSSIVWVYCTVHQAIKTVCIRNQLLLLLLKYIVYYTS